MKIRQVDQSLDKRKRRLLLIFILIFTIIATALLNNSPLIRVQSDLFSRWYATKQLIETGRSIYDPQNSEEIIILKAKPTIDLDARFYYPAHLLILLIPLSFLPFSIANFIWLLSIQLLYIVSIWLLVKKLDWPETFDGLTAFLLLSVFFIPYVQHTIWSQFNVLGAFSLIMAYLAIREDGFALAGIWAAGLTFKPQSNLLVLVYIMIWAVSSRKRWKFILYFFLTIFLLWGCTEIIQPGWVTEFINGLQDYTKLPYKLRSVLDEIWNPLHLLTIIAVVSAIAIFINFRHSHSSDTTFNACLLMAVSVWWLVMPVLGMLHLVLFPVTVIIIISELKKFWPSLVQPSLILWITLYIVGYVGFLYGLASPERYGLHIKLAEFVYKDLATLQLLGYSILLLFISKRSSSLPTFPQ